MASYCPFLWLCILMPNWGRGRPLPEFHSHNIRPFLGFFFKRSCSYYIHFSNIISIFLLWLQFFRIVLRITIYKNSCFSGFYSESKTALVNYISDFDSSYGKKTKINFLSKARDLMISSLDKTVLLTPSDDSQQPLEPLVSGNLYFCVD